MASVDKKLANEGYDDAGRKQGRAGTRRRAVYRASKRGARAKAIKLALRGGRTERGGRAGA